MLYEVLQFSDAHWEWASESISPLPLRERDRKVHLTCTPYVSMAVRLCFICKAKRNTLSRLNYRLELPPQLTEKSFLLHSQVETMKYVQLSLKLFVTCNYRTPLQELLYTTYLTLTSCPCHLHLLYSAQAHKGSAFNAHGHPSYAFVYKR